MQNGTVYRTTAKGKAEVADKPGQLKPGMKGLLAAVGAKATAESLRTKFPKAGDITAALAQLASDGYIEVLPAAAAKPAPVAKPVAAKPAAAKPVATQPAPAPAVDDDDLDMSALFAKPPKEPTLQRLKQAEMTMSGKRRLKAGYQVSIINSPGKPLAPRGGGKQHVILIIDGYEAEALEAARSMMQGGFDVRGAGTKAEIITALGKKPIPDLIFMDVELPDAVGLDLIGKLHEHPDLKSTPIIIVSARAERDDIVAALAYGASGYLNKPVKPDVLLRHARDALGLA